MAQFNILERTLARALARFPAVKRVAKDLYCRMSYMRLKKPYRWQAVSPPDAIGPRSSESFFGYYDHCPENGQGLILVNLSTRRSSVRPGLEQEVTIAVIDPAVSLQGAVLEVPLSAYNWQQGARAQWLSDDVFLFNDHESGHPDYVARAWSVSEARELVRFERPVQDAFGQKFFLSINYRRLMALRPDYGYRNLHPLSQPELRELDGDGIWRVEFDSGQSRLLVPLQSVVDKGWRKDFEQAFHKVNHVSISPSGEKCMFLHRWFLNGRRHDRLMIADCHSGELVVLADHDMVSHCFWVQEGLVLGFLRGPDGSDNYWLIDATTGEFRRLDRGPLQGVGDGHPHVVGDWFVTDTYPDKARMQHLFLVNWRTGEVKELGEFFHGFEFDGECRCDLHPRLSLDAQRVYFDSVFSGKRSLYRLDLSA